MAYIKKRGEYWRAEVRRKGHKPTYRTAKRLTAGEEQEEEPFGIEAQLSNFQQLFVTYIGRRSDRLPELKRAIVEAFFARRLGIVPYWFPIRP